MKRSLREFTKNPVKVMNTYLDRPISKWPFPCRRVFPNKLGLVDTGVLADGRYFARLGDTFAISG
jgi:hypothetical protein